MHGYRPKNVGGWRAQGVMPSGSTNQLAGLHARSEDQSCCTKCRHTCMPNGDPRSRDR